MPCTHIYVTGASETLVQFGNVKAAKLAKKQSLRSILQM